MMELPSVRANFIPAVLMDAKVLDVPVSDNT